MIDKVDNFRKRPGLTDSFDQDYRAITEWRKKQEKEMENSDPVSAIANALYKYIQIENEENNREEQLRKELEESPLKEKQNIIIDDLKEMLALATRLCSDYDAQRDMLINREMTDLHQEEYTQDDFAEAVYCYLNSYNNQLSGFLEKYIDDNYE